MKVLVITDHNSYTNSDHPVLYINKYSNNTKDFSLLSFIDENSLSIKNNLKKILEKYLTKF